MNRSRYTRTSPMLSCVRLRWKVVLCWSRARGLRNRSFIFILPRCSGCRWSDQSPEWSRVWVESSVVQGVMGGVQCTE